MFACHQPSRLICPWRAGKTDTLGVCTLKDRVKSACGVIEECKTAGPPLKLPNPDKNAKETHIFISQECPRIIQGHCRAYDIPAIKWAAGKCPLRAFSAVEPDEDRKINPLKASKRAAKKKG